MGDKEIKVLAIIPARSGSKSVPHKNIRPLAGKPLLAHSIDHAKASRYITRIVLNTDSEEYAAIGRQFGAETPFIRPSEFAQDLSTDLDVFSHQLKWHKENEGYVPDLVVQLRPTHPVRDVAEIDKCIEIMLENPKYDCVRTIMPAPLTPFKMWFKGDDGTIRPCLEHPTILEAYNQPRQNLTPAYIHNGSIDVIRASVIADQHSVSGKVIYGYSQDHMWDIDTEEDWQRTERYINSTR